MYTKVDDTHFKLIGEKKENIFPTLETRVYNLDANETFFGVDFIFSPMERYDNAKVAQAGIFKEVYEYTKGFFNEARTTIRKEMGFVNKMNLILKGDPGTGKTHLACTIASEIVKEHEGIGIVLNSIENVKFDKLIDRIRINEPDRLIVFVLDELEKNAHHRLTNSNFLAFLDGAKSRENVIIIATVNSINNFPNFLIQRPGRFEKIFDFVFNTEEIISELTEELLPERFKGKAELNKDITERAIVSNVKTIDELRFLILNYLVASENGVELEPVVSKKKKKEKKKEEKAEVIEKIVVENEGKVLKKASDKTTLLDQLAAAMRPSN